MANVTLSSSWDLRSFRSGIGEMKAEVGRFNESFKKGIENGGGLFGSIDKAFGKLATGRLAAPMAAVGAALTVAKVASEAMSKYWDNVADATARARQNIEAIESTRTAVQGAAKAGDAANTALNLDVRGKANEAARTAAEAAEFGDPSTNAGRRKIARAIAGDGLGGLFQYAMLSASAFIPGMGGAYDAANEEYKRRQDAAAKARQDADRAAQLKPFQEYENRSAQRAGDAAQESSQERLDVGQGRMTGYEAAARALIRANTQYQDARRTYKNENDPRVQQARAAALDAFGAYDKELTTARRYRNDPTISADSLARIGGGGGVNVFGNGRGELVFSQDRLTKSIDALTPAIRELGQTLSRTSSTGGRGSDITR